MGGSARDAKLSRYLLAILCPTSLLNLFFVYQPWQLLLYYVIVHRIPLLLCVVLIFRVVLIFCAPLRLIGSIYRMCCRAQPHHIGSIMCHTGSILKGLLTWMCIRASTYNPLNKWLVNSMDYIANTIEHAWETTQLLFQAFPSMDFSFCCYQ